MKWTVFKQLINLLMKVIKRYKIPVNNSPFIFRMFMVISFILLPAIAVFSQNNSKILLIYTDLRECDDGCKKDTKNFRDLFKTTIAESVLFKKVISYSIYKRKEKENSFNAYCGQNQISYFMLSSVTETKDINGKSKYNIQFRLFDLNNNEIENPRLKFSISVNQPGSSSEKILSGLKTELDHFNSHNYKFKELVKVESFEDMGPDGENVHIEKLPIWLADKLNNTKTTNRDYYFHYVTEGVNEQMDDYFISGQLKFIKNNDSIQVAFWMNKTENKVVITLDDDYWANEEKAKKIVIKEVLAILQKLQ